MEKEKNTIPDSQGLIIISPRDDDKSANEICDFLKKRIEKMSEFKNRKFVVTWLTLDALIYLLEDGLKPENYNLKYYLNVYVNEIFVHGFVSRSNISKIINEVNTQIKLGKDPLIIQLTKLRNENFPSFS